MVDLNPKALRAAFGSYMTGVTVVTAQADDGTHVGFTANSFTSVSLDPPLLLVCPGNHLSSFEVFKNAKHFAVNILAEGQEDVSNHFASSKEDRFANAKWQADAFGSPVLEGVSAYFSCSRHDCIDAGDHIILIGQVQDFETSQRKGLGYASSGYFTLGQPEKASDDTNVFFAGALVECDGHVLVTETDGKLDLPSIELADRYRASLVLAQHFDASGLKIDIGQTYSVFDDSDTDSHHTFFRATTETIKNNALGRFVKISDLDPSQFKQSHTEIMMRRFKSEIANQQFGLFIGNAVSGEVRAAPQS